MTARLTIDAVKVGDRVKCVQPDGCWLLGGNTYQVKDVFDGLITLNTAPSILWSPDRFVAVPSTLRANLHAPAEVQPPAPPGVTDAQASISDGWWA